MNKENALKDIANILNIYACQDSQTECSDLSGAIITVQSVTGEEPEKLFEIVPISKLILN